MTSFPRFVDALPLSVTRRKTVQLQDATILETPGRRLKTGTYATLADHAR